MSSFKKLILAGELPYIAVLAFAITGFYAGQQFKNDAPKVAIAERSAVILEAVLERHGDTQETLQNEITQPVLNVLKRYADLGYVVIDTSRDDAGNYSVAALPADAINITDVLRQAVKKKPEASTQPRPDTVSKK